MNARIMLALENRWVSLAGIMQHQPFDTSLQAGLEELEMACYKAVEGALDAAGVKACEVISWLTKQRPTSLACMHAFMHAAWPLEQTYGEVI